MMFDAKLTFLKQPDGSCRIHNGKTELWCSVNGPGDIQSSKRIFDRIKITFTINRLASEKSLEIAKATNTGLTKTSSFMMDSTPSTSLIESVVYAAVDSAMYPRMALHVCAQEIKSDTSLNSALLNGICLALLDAGIYMRYPFAALTVIKLPKPAASVSDTNVTHSVGYKGADESMFIVEPSNLRAEKAAATFLFVFRPSVTAEGGGTLVASDTRGRFSFDDMKIAQKLAQSQCLAVFDLYRKCIFEKFAPFIVQ